MIPNDNKTKELIIPNEKGLAIYLILMTLLIVTTIWCNIQSNFNDDMAQKSGNVKGCVKESITDLSSFQISSFCRSEVMHYLSQESMYAWLYLFSLGITLLVGITGITIWWITK